VRRRTGGDGGARARATAAHGRALASGFCWCSVQHDFSQNFQIELDQVMNTKVVDLGTSNIFYKGCIGVFCLDLKLFECQL
jgi:hypothetical protein